MARSNGDFLTKRGGQWHYVRRVPVSLRDFDPRKFVRQTTNVSIAEDPRGQKARKAVEVINRETEAYWRGLIEGQAVEARRRYDAARKRARSFGFDYAPAAELAIRPGAADDIMARLEKLISRGAQEDEGAVAAVLGGEEPPALTLSGMFAEYEALERASITDLSPDQRRKWENPKRRAIANLISVIGDKALHRISRNDALDFRTWWQDRVIEEGVEVATANKDIGHLNRMVRTIDRRFRLGLPALFSDLRIEGETSRSRAAFTAPFIADRLLADRALTGLNEEARRVLYVMVETGLRLSEVVNLTAETIHLDAPVPYIQVRPDGRRMKTPQSERDTPLVGVALAAMRLQPEGFPRYRDKAASLSATVNKYLAENGLRPTPAHSAYSLRHAYEDRLTAVEAPEKLIAALMGHKYARPKYGSGPSLAQKAEWLHRIAFTGWPSSL